jgi:hypothetical protein
VVTAATRDAQRVQSDVWVDNIGGARASSQKAMFLCTVALGNPIALREVDHDFDAGVRFAAPRIETSACWAEWRRAQALSDSDADSVNGDPDLIKGLNFHEDVVYDVRGNPVCDCPAADAVRNRRTPFDPGSWSCTSKHTILWSNDPRAGQ